MERFHSAFFISISQPGIEKENRKMVNTSSGLTKLNYLRTIPLITQGMNNKNTRVSADAYPARVILLL
jgi:hypothetical protein